MSMVEVAKRKHNEFRSKIAEVSPHVAGIPKAPLGPFGDIPAAYAVFQLTRDEEADGLVRTYYAYVSSEYCRLANYTQEELIGCSHLEVVKSELPNWTENCLRAVVDGTTTNGVDYSSVTQSWVSYSIAPTAIEDCCACVFVPIDEEERISQMSIDAKTSQTISALLGMLAGEKSYEAAMNGMLEMTAEVLPSDRLCVFVCSGAESKNTFELCADGVKPQVGTVSALSRDVLNAWFSGAADDHVALVPDTAVLARFSQPLYEWCQESGIKNLLAAPFYNEGEIVGFLGAYNYRIDGSIDINRVFAALSSFVGSRIDNHRLIEDLEWAGDHDALTGLLNRRGASSALEKAIAARPDAPVVVALIDLDDFKNTNDQFGHAAGDCALQAMGHFLTESFPDTAVLCRTGGDEFLVQIVDENVEQAEKLIESFAEMQMEYEYEGNRRPMSASMGYACYPAQAVDLTDAFSKADRALYAVKHRGKSGCLKYSPDIE